MFLSGCDGKFENFVQIFKEPQEKFEMFVKDCFRARLPLRYHCRKMAEFWIQFLTISTSIENVKKNFTSLELPLA